jgi:hypothetical protein
MLFPKYVLEDLSVGSGSIIGKSNIEEFLNHISMHKDVEDKSLAELAPSYKVASAYLVHMLEARFASFNPFMQHIFLKLHDIEDSEKKDFILETLRREFRDVAIEALEKNFNWICPENLFDESSVPKHDHKGSSKTYLDTIQFIVEKTSAIDFNASFYITCFALSAPSSKALKKSTLGR